MNDKELARALKALANQRRLAIVHYLKGRKEAPVGEIAAAIKLSFRATSKHLGVLAAADVVDREQRGTQMFYTIVKPASVVVRAVLPLV